MIAAYLIVGPGEADRYLETTLKQIWADVTFILLNNADDKTAEVARRYGQVTVDNREWGKNQWRIKQDFLNSLPLTSGDWVWCLDADEIFDRRFTRKKAEQLMAGKDISYQFWCIQLWNDEHHWRKDMSFPNVRFYKYLPEFGLHFHPTPLHCGLAPLYAYKYPSDSGMIFKHYGLMTKEERARRITRYNTYDPEAKYKAREWYLGLSADIQPEPFCENEQFYAMLRDNNVIEYHRKKIPMGIKKQRRIFLFRNRHGKIVEAVGEIQYDMFIKDKNMTYIQDLITTTGNEAPVVESAPESVIELDNESREVEEVPTVSELPTESNESKPSTPKRVRRVSKKSTGKLGQE